MWHKADISISTGIPPTISRRRHGTTLSAETCIPVILHLRERRDWRRHREKAKDLLLPSNPAETVSNGDDPSARDSSTDPFA